MHFALPPRKTSHPPPYARTNISAAALRWRKQLKYVGYAVLGLLTFYLLLKFTLSDSAETDDGPSAIEGPQHIVLVTVLDNKTMSEDYMQIVRTNRDYYAARHGECNASGSGAKG